MFSTWDVICILSEYNNYIFNEVPFVVIVPTTMKNNFLFNHTLPCNCGLAYLSGGVYSTYSCYCCFSAESPLYDFLESCLRHKSEVSFCSFIQIFFF